MAITNLITGLFLLGLGFVVRVFKLSILISGYNTASPQKKAKYDEKILVKAVGNFAMILGGILFIGGIIGWLFSTYSQMIIIGSWVAFSLFVVIGLLYLNLTDKVKKKE